MKNGIESPYSLESHVLVPFIQACVLGALLGASLFVVAWLVKWDAWRFLFSGMTLGTLAGWIYYRGEVSRASARVGAPAPTMTTPSPARVYSTETPVVKLSIDWDEGRAGLFDELNISDELFIQWACGVGRGVSLGENWWCGARAPFSKGMYHRFLEKLHSLGFIRQAGKGYTSGWTLTSKGRAVCSGILARYGDITPPRRVKVLNGTRFVP